jgi:hypothetical protein
VIGLKPYLIHCRWSSACCRTAISSLVAQPVTRIKAASKVGLLIVLSKPAIGYFNSRKSCSFFHKCVNWYGATQRRCSRKCFAMWQLWQKGRQSGQSSTSAARELTRLSANCIPIAESRHIRDRPSPSVEQARQWTGFQRGFSQCYETFADPGLEPTPVPLTIPLCAASWPFDTSWKVPSASSTTAPRHWLRLWPQLGYGHEPS